jgi:N-methylhydantoinase A/oxoprolinase/acetone carboxylase beta subunit
MLAAVSERSERTGGAASGRGRGIPARSERHQRHGVDTGGTFTDAVDADGNVAKVLSTPGDPARAVATAVADLARGTRPAVLAHGTTVATNALLERSGASVALVATNGFADVIEIARQHRPSLYDPFADRPVPLVPRELRFEVCERLDAAGDELEPWDQEVPAIPHDVRAVAVCLLHSDLEPAHERAVAASLRRGGFDVTASNEISPEFREYERTITTVVNAYLRPACGPYLERIANVAEEVLVMTSAGGLVPVDGAMRTPAALLLSGPAGGVRAAAAIGAACGFANAVTFDMGGTSTDVCLVQGGVPEPAPQRVAGGFPIRLPALDIHTIGAGGGSIAGIDPGGALVVGPESAGSEPGPACYGRGGREPTVTDADLVLGRIDAHATFPGLGRLDLAAANAALVRAGVHAAGIVAVVDAAMQQAVRAVTVERGVDPRNLALIAFGGAGPLHACAIADALGMCAVVVPPRAGVCSAVGLLCAPRRQEVVRSIGPNSVGPKPVSPKPVSPDSNTTESIDAALADVARRARQLVGADAAVETAVDCRYVGQSHEITVATPDDFSREHERRNGHARPGAPVEVVAVRARATADAPLAVTDLPSASRVRVRGPALVAEADCTVWIPEGWVAEPRALGAWVMTRT